MINRVGVLSLLLLAIVMTHNPAIAADDDGPDPAHVMGVEEEFEGRFLSAEKPSILKLQWTFANEEGDPQWGSPVKVSIAGRQVLAFEESTYSGYEGICRNPETKRDTLVMTNHGGGNGANGIVYYVTYDPKIDKFVITEEGPFVEFMEEDLKGRDCSDDAKIEGLCRCTLSEMAGYAEASQDALSQLRIEAAAGDNTLEHFTSAKLNKPFAIATRDLGSDISHILALVAQSDLSEIELLAENDLWKVVQLYRTELFAAEGAVLAFDKKQKRWMTIYNIPSGGSKSLNFPIAEEPMLKGNKLVGQLCIECEWWGRYAWYEIDLHKKSAVLLSEEEELPN